MGAIPESWEPISAAMGGGWITVGPHGEKHLVGASWAWWACPHCLAVERNARRRAMADSLAAMSEVREKMNYGR